MTILTEKEAEDFLEKAGFRVVKRVLIKNKEELKQVKIQFPWVMKISSKHIVHKAKIGGTKLGIKTFEEAEETLEKLCSIHNCEDVLVQEFIEGKEFIIGVKHTPEFGKVIMFGKGGSKVEEDKDISFRVAPLQNKDIEEMINELRSFESLKKEVNIDQIKKSLLKMSELAITNPNIDELDINPLIVNKEKAWVVDARIEIKD